jgi:excisionase family DNA binding protein
MTKREAAFYCRISLRTFERIVQPGVGTIRIGARILFHRQEIDRWLEQQGAGGFANIHRPGFTGRGSATADAGTSVRAGQILAQLRTKGAAAMPASLPDNDPKVRDALPSSARLSAR